MGFLVRGRSPAEGAVAAWSGIGMEEALWERVRERVRGLAGPWIKM